MKRRPGKRDQKGQRDSKRSVNQTNAEYCQGMACAFSIVDGRQLMVLENVAMIVNSGASCTVPDSKLWEDLFFWLDTRLASVLYGFWAAKTFVKVTNVITGHKCNNWLQL